jgi:hypothetical protein
MFKRHDGPASDPAEAGHKNRTWVICLTAILGLALIGSGAYFCLHRTKKVSAGSPVQEPVARLVSTSGMILVQTSGNPEWREVKTGAPFNEGDLVRTDDSGDAGIQYKNGTVVSIPRNTIMKVRKVADNLVEISASPDASMPPIFLEAETDISGKWTGPSVELQQIIQFGKSLELIGRVEAGSSLLINGEIAEVTGEGQFKHFTRPFAASAEIVRLNLKVTDLAGRTRTYRTTHDFRTHGGDN